MLDYHGHGNMVAMEIQKDHKTFSLPFKTLEEMIDTYHYVLEELKFRFEEN